MTKGLVNLKRILFSLLVVMPSSGVHAQATYPTRAVHFITPFPPGGSLDPMTRMAAQKLGERWGQPTVVENRPGANTIIGTQAVARAAPDGYTLLVVGTPFVVMPSLFPAPYDVQRDFAPITSMARSRQILVVNPALPVRTLKELITFASSRPGQINYSSSGAGNINHLSAELLNMIAGIKLQHIPYKGGGPAVTDVISGQVQVSFQVPISVIQHVKTGRLRALAVSGQTRLPALPQVLTFAEAGLPAYEITGWNGMFAPAATPRDIIEKISLEMAKILALPEIIERFTAQGLEPMILSTEQFTAFLKADLAKYAKLIKDAKIKVE